MKFSNPIIPGFSPDPSVVLVKGTYYLVNSSFHVFPGLPIYTSTDLQHWTLVGHAINRSTQINLSGVFTDYFADANEEKLVVTGGLFAPTIRHHQNTFYIICTTAHNPTEGPEHSFDNFIVTCPEDEILASNWSDPIPVDFPGIDPSLFFDPDTDKAYFCGSHRTGPPWNPNCTIQGFEIDVKTGKPLTDLTFLWEGYAGKADAEGPHIYKKDGWFYLLTAENSTFEGHQINIARSRAIEGPYENCPANPLLTAEHKDVEVKWTGHGDLFRDESGAWWCVHLGVREMDAGKRIPLCRETFLTSVEWRSGEWPEIQQTTLEFERAASFEPSKDLSSWERLSSNRLEDVYVRTPILDNYDLSGKLQDYTLRPQPSTTLSCVRGTTTFIGRRQRLFKTTASTTLKLETLKENSAGLCVFKDRLRHASIYADGTLSKIIFRIVVLDNGEAKTSTTEMDETSLSATGAVHFKIDASDAKYVFSYMLDKEWKVAGTIDTAAMTAHDMTAVLFGIFAETDNEATNSWIKFEGFNTCT